jgi:hypothetical protein
MVKRTKKNYFLLINLHFHSPLVPRLFSIFLYQSDFDKFINSVK